ncbi:hypothetical protein K4G60_g3732 [Candida parapsilosis]|nr:hypothetical protein K4G60_g3732 [Candida parapsilosis]KAI5907512.1 hypothetical protein K4G61_g1173 [Candida parapsilosis]CAD1809648.1 unnamed protein product [Candida parapsilosis]
MRLIYTPLFISLATLSQARQFHLDTGSNAVCFQVSNPTTVEITRTLGTEPIPIAIFEYGNRHSLKNLPNFDFLVTDAKLDEYFEFGEFTFSNGSPTAFNTSLGQKLEFDVTSTVWCLYTPKVSSYEYKVDVREYGYYEKYDDLWWLVVNIVVSLFFARLFYFGSNPPILYMAEVNLQLIKVAVFLFTTILVVFNLNVAKYADYISASLDDVLTMLFLSGYGLTYANRQDYNVKKVAFITLLCVVPAFGTRYFDLKNNIQYISINNQHYNVVQGVMGSEVYDGLDRVARLTQENMINKLSGVVALLFAVSKIIKIGSYVYAIKKTLKSLTVVNPIARPYYIGTIIIWLFLWSLISVALAPDMFYNFTNVTNYAKVLKEFLISYRQRKFITFLWDESHWIVFWLIWYFGKGMLKEEKVDVKDHVD